MKKNEENNTSTSNASAKSSTGTHTENAVGGASLLVIGGALTARFIYNQLLVDPEQDQEFGFGKIRKDASKATVLLDTTNYHSGADPTAKLTLDALDERTKVLHQVDAQEFSNFCRQQKKILQNAERESRTAAKEHLRKELVEAMHDAYGRIPAFASWYFAYTTTWKLLSVALTSAAKHAVTFRSEQTLSQKVSEDLQIFVCQKYEAIVLRPAWTNAKIHGAFVKSIRNAHDIYLESCQELESSVAQFVSNQTKRYRIPPQPSDIIVDVDWRTQLQKADHLPVTFEKSPEFSAILIGATAVAGKVAGTGAAAGATKAMIGKIVSPFVTKAVGATMSGGVATASATGGAMVGGPVGAAFGAAIGLGVDVMANAGVALVQRSSFEEDVEKSLDATIREWENNLFPEMERIHRIWFDHAESLLDVSSSASSNISSTSASTSTSTILREVQEEEVVGTKDE